ncbi:MAG: DUF2795 domain-containing protein [Halobacteriota archaeon]
MARDAGGHGPANIMDHLKGIDFPARKNDLVEHARETEGPDTDEVVNTLEKLPAREYISPADVMHEVSEVE